MTTPAAASATSGTVAGRPQPQTTAEPAGGPFVRHAPAGRRAMYVNASAAQGMQNAQFIANPMVSSPGWNKGYRINVSWTGGNSTPGTISADSPWDWFQLVQMKDAFGTQLLTGPGYDIAYLVPTYGGQFGLDHMRTIQNSPVFQPVFSASGAGYGNATWSTYLPFEFAKGYGVISGANAALLPVLQINTAPYSTVISGGAVTTYPTTTVTVDSDFYWLPNTPSDPPGIGTTLQWIYQPCNPTIPSAGSQLVQLPRLGGYLTTIILDLRDSTGARMIDTAAGTAQAGAAGALNGVGWPTRPKLLVDGVPLVDTLMSTWVEDLAIQTGLGNYSANALSSAAGTPSGTLPTPRPSGTFGISYKTSMSQKEFGLFDTGEIFLSTNPGTQLEIGGFPWGTASNSPMTLNALVGQVVPSGTLIQGLPEI